MHTETVVNDDISLNVIVEGDGPLILCVHGWPELGYSWRHQIEHFSKLGYRVAALDMRGYGGSSKPPEIAAYTLRNLASDVHAVARTFGGGKPVTLFGQDWGAPTAFTTALLYPETFGAIAVLSVPFWIHRGESILSMLRPHYEGRYFYQNYFQAEGVAEAEIEADIPTAIRKIYYALCGDAELDKWIADRPEDSTLLSDKIDPNPFPAWLTDADLNVYIEAFTRGGMRCPINRYRAQFIDEQDLDDIKEKRLAQPSFFLGGERDPIRHFFPGMDLYADPAASCDDFRGSYVIPGSGHWTPQEKPDIANAALKGFLDGL